MYLDSIGNEKVYLGYTYNEAREKQIGLGLDLKGGMNVTLQISVPDILRTLSKENPDPKFNQAIANAEKSKAKDFVLHSVQNTNSWHQVHNLLKFSDLLSV